METTLTLQKQLTNVKGTLHLNNESARVSGYEIHVGVSEFAKDAQSTSLITLDNGSTDGLVSPCGQILGTYLHGVFDEFETASLICRWAGAEELQAYDHVATKELAINRIADAIEKHMNWDSLWDDSLKVK